MGEELSPAAAEEGADSRARRSAGRALLLVALAVCLRFAYLDRFFELDDALIYHRFVQNAIDGHGLVYNPGERYNALTSPLYTALSLGLTVEDVQSYPERLDAVTVESVNEAARRIFKPERSVTGLLLPQTKG